MNDQSIKRRKKTGDLSDHVDSYVCCQNLYFLVPAAMYSLLGETRLRRSPTKSRSREVGASGESDAFSGDIRVGTTMRAIL